jgi:hypothetical protein
MINDEKTNNLELAKLPKMTLMFDLDNVLVDHAELEGDEKLYFMRKSGVITATGAQHQILPGALVNKKGSSLDI